MSEILTKLLPAEVLNSKERVRPAFAIGKIAFSVQASEGHYCSPKVTGRPLTDYALFEMALGRHPRSRRRKSDFYSPRELQLEYPETKDKQWKRSGVGSFVGLLELVELLVSARDLDLENGGDGIAKVIP